MYYSTFSGVVILVTSNSPTFLYFYTKLGLFLQNGLGQIVAPQPYKAELINNSLELNGLLITTSVCGTF